MGSRLIVCSRLLEPQKVAPNAKRCSKVAVRKGLVIGSPDNVKSSKKTERTKWSLRNVLTFGRAKRSGSDRECKYFPIYIHD